MGTGREASAKGAGFFHGLRAGDAGGILRRHSDLAVAALVVSIVAMMIVPLPAALLDLLIALNIAGAVTLLLVSIYVSDALRIATFPTLLLLTTLFRLALEVSASRLILVRASAGDVIHAFGAFVVAGNLVVGAVIFLILTIIQFVVVAKGAERVAEVAARFTLDALPGRQMAIDAELRAGHIERDEARARRAALARESQLFGAMDGAMKFVKGDAVAGIVVLAVNIVGGLVIGVLQRGLDLSTAARTYTLLTIGAGLVAQIPALILSTAAGIIVTRVAPEDDGAHLGHEISDQLLGQPKAIAIAAVLLGALALVPGLPFAPFVVLAAALGLLARGLLRAQASIRGRRAVPGGAARGDAALGAAASRPTGRSGTAMAPLLAPLEIELGADLARTVLADGDAESCAERLSGRVGDPLFSSRGITLPTLTVTVAEAGATAIPRDGYVIRLNEVPRDRGQLPGAEPVVAEARLADRLMATLEQSAHELIGIEETQTLLGRLARSHPALVREVVPKIVSPTLLAEVLRRLAEEGVSLRPLKDVLGALAEHAPLERDPAALAEHARAALRRAITHRHANANGVLPALEVDPMIEDAVRESLHKTASGTSLALEPQLAREIVEAVGRAVVAASAPAADAGATARPPVILASADVRRHLRHLVETTHPRLAVLSHREIAPETEVLTVGRIAAGAAPSVPAGP